MRTSPTFQENFTAGFQTIMIPLNPSLDPLDPLDDIYAAYNCSEDLQRHPVEFVIVQEAYRVSDPVYFRTIETWWLVRRQNAEMLPFDDKKTGEYFIIYSNINLE
jgi:hypothetical protein